MTQRRVTAKARVRLTIEIGTSGTWGADCPISQVQQQACEEVELNLAKRLNDVGFYIVGDPEVQVVLLLEQR